MPSSAATLSDLALDWRLYEARNAKAHARYMAEQADRSICRLGCGADFAGISSRTYHERTCPYRGAPQLHIASP